MAGYLQINREILNSTVWVGTDCETKTLWFFLLFAADIKTGIVPHTLPAIVRDTGISREKIDEIIRRFSLPDPDSRSKDNEGRRIELVDPENPNGGIKILNYFKYRDMHSSSKNRMRNKRIRDKNNSCDGRDVTVTSRDVTVTHVTSLVTKEKEKEKEKEKKRIPPPPCSEFSDEPLPSPSSYRETKQLQAKLAAESLETNPVAAPDIAQVVERLNAAQAKYFTVPGSLDSMDPKIRRAALKGLEWCKGINAADPGKILAQSWLTCIEECDKSKKKPVFEWFVKDISNYYREFKKQAAGN